MKRLYWQFLVEIAIWTVTLPLCLALLSQLIQSLDFQWAYDWSPAIYYPIRELFFASTYDYRISYIVNIVIWAAGVLFLSHRLLRRTFSTINMTLSQASAAMFDKETQNIVLPQELEDIQAEMNHLKRQSEQNEQLAKEADQRKNDLVVYLAHDLKTPLTSVIGYLTLLHDAPELTPELRAKYTGVALNKALRLEDLINEFFDITRFSLTNIELSTESVNLTRMLEQITFEFNPVLSEKDLSWDCSFQPDVKIVCDPDKLERVFDNLLRNAINYSYRETSIRIHLETQENQAVVQIENCGKTIPPEKLSHIFEQFFRMDSSRGSATGGSGLGLAIAKEIVELHGGTVTAASSNEHILFTVSVPMNYHKIV